MATESPQERTREEEIKLLQSPDQRKSDQAIIEFFAKREVDRPQFQLGQPVVTQTLMAVDRYLEGDPIKENPKFVGEYAKETFVLGPGPDDNPHADSGYPQMREMRQVSEGWLMRVFRELDRVAKEKLKFVKELAEPGVDPFQPRWDKLVDDYKKLTIDRKLPVKQDVIRLLSAPFFKQTCELNDPIQMYKNLRDRDYAIAWIKAEINKLQYATAGETGEQNNPEMTSAVQKVQEYQTLALEKGVDTQKVNENLAKVKNMMAEDRGVPKAIAFLNEQIALLNNPQAGSQAGGQRTETGRSNSTNGTGAERSKQPPNLQGKITEYIQLATSKGESTSEVLSKVRAAQNNPAEALRIVNEAIALLNRPSARAEQTKNNDRSEKKDGKEYVRPGGIPQSEIDRKKHELLQLKEQLARLQKSNANQLAGLARLPIWEFLDREYAKPEPGEVTLKRDEAEKWLLKTIDETRAKVNELQEKPKKRQNEALAVLRNFDYNRKSRPCYASGEKNKKSQLPIVYKDYYAILGANVLVHLPGENRDQYQKAEEEYKKDLQKKYRKLSKQFHPDMWQDLEGFDDQVVRDMHRAFKLITDAYDILNDANKRKTLDESIQRSRNLLEDKRKEELRDYGIGRINEIYSTLRGRVKNIDDNKRAIEQEKRRPKKDQKQDILSLPTSIRETEFLDLIDTLNEARNLLTFVPDNDSRKKGLRDQGSTINKELIRIKQP